jgi:hypothetical protein
MLTWRRAADDGSGGSRIEEATKEPAAYWAHPGDKAQDASHTFELEGGCGTSLENVVQGAGHVVAASGED